MRLCWTPPLSAAALPCFQVPPNEQGMRDITRLVTTFPQGFMLWQGPIFPLIVFCHPDMIRAITSASGTDRARGGGCCGTSEASSSSLPCFCVASAGSGPLPPFSLSIFLFSSCIQTRVSLPPPSSVICLLLLCPGHPWSPNRLQSKVLFWRSSQT